MTRQLLRSSCVEHGIVEIQLRFVCMVRLLSRWSPIWSDGAGFKLVFCFASKALTTRASVVAFRQPSEGISPEDS